MSFGLAYDELRAGCVGMVIGAAVMLLAMWLAGDGRAR